jgi:hypothetical protein
MSNPSQGTIVELTAFDLLEIALFAERQHSVKVATGAVSKKYDTTKSEYELHYVGAMAEYAVAQYFGVPMDRSVHRGGDNGTDVVINGWRCEIKANTYTGRNYQAFIDGMHVFRADVLISVQILSPTKVRLVGCISRVHFEKIAQPTDYGHGERLFVPEKELASLDVLVKTDRPTKGEVNEV